MRFMIIHKLDDTRDEDGNPGPELIDRVAALIGELSESGVLLAGEGLRPSKDGPGARITHKNGKPQVIDGPFAEAKEVVGGFIIVDLKSREEAVDLALRYSECIGSVEVEVRRLTEEEDLG